MKYLLILFFCIFLSSDDDDIVVRKTIDSDVYKDTSNSFCKPKPSPTDGSWFEDFVKPTLSKKEWNYSISNGFYDDGEYISGWGNGEIQYYTNPKKNNNKNTTKNLFIEDGFLKIQPIKNLSLIHI